MLEYRTVHGVPLEVAAGGQLRAAVINLRSLGCPDWLASKVERAREMRANSEPTISKGTTVAVPDDDLRKRAAAIGVEVAADQSEIRRQEELKQRMQILSGRTTR